MFNLNGKTAVVTGGNRGIGKHIALGLARQGASVAIVDLAVGADTLAEIRALGVKALGYEYDLRQFDGYRALAQKIVDDFGSFDILVNNAGVQKRHPCAEFPQEDWDMVMDINAKAVFFFSQAAVHHMLRAGGGKIINMASLLSFQGGFTVPAYAASKGAVAQFTKSMSNEWASKNINVNGIAPGYLDTELNTAIVNDPVRSRQILERIPAGRWGLPEDIVGTAVFLASSASNYISGTIIPVDGGWLGR